MTKQLDKIREQRDAALAEANDLLTRTEGSDLEGEALERFEHLTSEAERLNERYEKIAELIELSKNPNNLEAGWQSPAEVYKDIAPHLFKRVTPWEPSHPSDTMQTRQDRALAAITDVRGELIAPEDRARVESLVRRDELGEITEYITAASDPVYRRAFSKWARDPQVGHLAFTPEEQHAFARVAQTRTAMSEGNSSAMLPVAIDPSIVLTNTGALGAFRTFSRVETIGTSAWKGVTSAGVTASFSAEAAEVTDDSPTVSTATVTPARATAYIQASWELVMDANITDEVVVLLADAKKRLEESKFSTGSGTNEPRGIVTALGLVTASRVSATTNGSFGHVDLLALGKALPARYQENASFLSNFGWEYVIRDFASSSSPLSSTFWVDLAGSAPPRLLGKNYYRTSGMQAPPLSATTASNDDIVVLGDFRQYLIADRIGMSVAAHNWVVGANRRPTAEWGFLGFWRVGADLINTDAARMLRV